MKTSNKGLSLIKKYEGLKLQAYKCPAGIPTVGYGHTRAVKMGQTITEKQAHIYLTEDVIDAENCINRLNLPLNQNQFDALVSFTFNLGAGNLYSSTLLKKIKLNVNDPLIRNEFNKWIYANKIRLDGLVKRRGDESNLYFS